ncbi:hypothetical protein AMAG_18513 [Allomyces macrogynus ATCC 38327]|uniref:Uncharacterized protein n=1 Tax=Allomyces macrogynus (strain ATCC 38327) TaxID=578462 RepID=A0A0L0SD16_ALLM3|nr:hypothetical protein AMAG_18513 [Allomyces macrogynus ATCC 38327]|eukprot:KNE60319.1 hypothetical protein AMAG_18513 [Allomyces macrogynus ATCC 38327]
MASAPPAGPSAKAPELAASKHSRSALFHASTTIPVPPTATMPAKTHGNASGPARARTDSVLSAMAAMGGSGSDHDLQPQSSASSSRRRGSPPNPAHQQRRRSLWLGKSGPSFDSDDADDEGRSTASPLAALRSRLAKTSASAARAMSKAVTAKSASGNGAGAANVRLPAGRSSGGQPEMEAGSGDRAAPAARLPSAPLAATTATAPVPPAAPAAPAAVPVIHTVPRRPSGSRLAAAVAAAFTPAGAPAAPPTEAPLPAPAPAPASSAGTATTSPSDNVPIAMLATRAATFHGTPSTSSASTSSAGPAPAGVIPRRKASGSHAPPLRRPASMVHDVSSPEFQHLAGIFGWDLASGRPDVRSPCPGSDSPPATAIPSPPVPTPSSAAGSVFQRRHQNDVNWWKSIEASYKKRASAASNGSANATPGVVPAVPTSAGRNSVRSSRAWPGGRVSAAGNVAGAVGVAAWGHTRREIQVPYEHDDA